LVRQTYAAMTDLVRDPEDSRALGKLNDLRAAFETASAISDSPMRDLDDEVRRIRLQAAVDIGRAETAIAHIADRDRGTSRDSRRLQSGILWKPRSIAPAPPSANAKELDAIRNVRSAGMDAAFDCLVPGGGEGRDPGPFSRPKPISPDTPTSPKPASTPSCITKRRDAEKTE